MVKQIIMVCNRATIQGETVPELLPFGASSKNINILLTTRDENGKVYIFREKVFKVMTIGINAIFVESIFLLLSYFENDQDSDSYHLRTALIIF